MKNIFFLITSIGVVFCAFASAPAGDLRGRVDGVTQYAPAPFPLSGARVEIAQPNNPGSVVVSYRTGRDGMYYFRNIQPGQYTLTVNETVKVPLQVEDKPLQDIGPVLFSY